MVFAEESAFGGPTSTTPLSSTAERWTPSKRHELDSRTGSGSADLDAGSTRACNWQALALEAFERLGAHLWADMAVAELDATGVTAHRRGTGPVVDLTARELQIALLLSDGKTTREAAAALFVSPKTIEYHLRHVYTKLDIGSRSELTARMRDST